jgi:ketosteroid isomerase-like protein
MLDPEIMHGLEGVRRFFEDATELFDEIHIDEEEMVDLGDEVLMVGNAHFKGHTSGASVEARAANLWNVRDGKVTRFRFFQTKEDALAAARAPQVGRG